MKLTSYDIARMIDASMLRPEVKEADLNEFARNAKKYHFLEAQILPYYASELNSLLEDTPDILVAAPIGFPSGAHKAAVKVLEAELALEDGCDELDMVINIGALRSGRFSYVGDEIKAIVAVAQDKPVKVILETHYLNKDEIKRCCELSIKARAAYVKTSTGWAETGATVENVALIKSFVGDAIKIKASGGIRNVRTLVEMYKNGARRFGISIHSAVKIIEQCNSVYDGSVEV